MRASLLSPSCVQTTSEPEPHGSPVPGLSRGLTPPPMMPPLPMSSLPDIPLDGTPLLGHPFADLLGIPTKGKWDHSPSNSLNHLYAKRTHITSPEVEGS